MREPATSPRSALPELRRQLLELVVSLFSEQEFRSWLRFGGPYDEILPFLPSPPTPFQHIAEEGLSALERRGWIDHSFFARLAKCHRPGYLIASRTAELIVSRSAELIASRSAELIADHPE